MGRKRINSDKQLSHATLAEVSPEQIGRLDRLLAEAGADMIERPFERKVRRVALVIEMAPDKNDPNRIDLQVNVDHRFPKYSGASTVVKLSREGQLLLDFDMMREVAEEQEAA